MHQRCCSIIFAFSVTAENPAISLIFYYLMGNLSFVSACFYLRSFFSVLLYLCMPSVGFVGLLELRFGVFHHFWNSLRYFCL